MYPRLNRILCTFLAGVLLAPVLANSQTEATPPDQVRSTLQGGPTVKQLYQLLAARHGITVVFDPQLEDGRISFELVGEPLTETLERLALAAGHFYRQLSDRTYLVVEDTPQKRREYEELVVRLFALSHADPATTEKTLRIIAGARKVVVLPEIDAVLVRDTAGRVAIMERIVALTDRPPAQVDLRVLLLELEPEVLARALQQSPPAAESIDQLRRQGRLLAGTRLSILGDREAILDQQTREEGWRLRLRARAQVHAAAGQVTIETEVTASDRRSGASTVTASVRLDDGASTLVTGLPRSQSDPDRQLVVVLTPVIVTAAPYDPEELEELSFSIGTECRISLTGRRLSRSR